jgi:hypothetical protein
VAAQFSEDPTVDVHRQRGALGELRVTVDGTDVVDTPALLYPTPTSVVKKVRAYLASASPGPRQG